MTQAQRIRERIEEGTPLRLGEFARLLGYSREHLRKLADAGVLRTERPDRPRSQRVVPVDEADRFARQERRL
jgi:hypothetical protein